MKRRIPLFYKLFFIFILCSTIPLLIIGGSMYGLSVDFLDSTLTEQTEASVSLANERINDRIRRYEAIMLTFAGHPSVRSGLSPGAGAGTQGAAIYEILYDGLIDQKIKPLVHVVDMEGETVYSTAELPEIHRLGLVSRWGLFRRTAHAESLVKLYAQRIDHPSGEASVLSLSTPVFNEAKKQIGYVILDVPRSVILEETQAIQSGLSLHITLVDRYGYTVLDTLYPAMEGKFQRANYLDEEKIGEHRRIADEIDKNSFLSIVHPNDFLDTTMYVNVSSGIFEAFDRILKLVLIIGGMVSLVIASILALVLARFISRPIHDLIGIMGQVEEGDLTVRADGGSNDEIGDLAKYFNQMLDRIKGYMEKTIENQRQLRVAEIKMLQAQIKPHFIYNTLDVIKWSAKLGHKDEAVSVVTNLAKLLRLSIDTVDEFVTVKDSMTLITSYLSIQKIKYNNAFELIEEIEEGILHYRIPRLILQPFVENAIVHGLGKVDRPDGLVRVSGRQVDDHLRFEIVDNGIGMTEQQMQLLGRDQPEHHIGIYNVSQRIKKYYGEAFGVEIESRIGEGTRVIITLPCREEGIVVV